MRKPTVTALLLLAVAVPAGYLLADTLDEALAFSGERPEIERLIAYYDEIELTPEQEAIRVAALEPLPAPCCAEFSAATCCCECNLSRATWGLSKYLITTLGYDAEQVRETVQAFHAEAGKGNWTGTSCFSGGCGRPMHADGCGGMSAQHLVH